MANNSVPNHDFAPSWLKIPSSDHLLKTSVDSNNVENSGGHASRRDEIFNCDPRPDYISNRNKRSHIFPSRHHSIDVDDSKFFFQDSSNRSLNHPGFRRDNANGKRGTQVSSSQYGSYPSLQRRPHSRHDFRSNDVGYHSHNKAYTNGSDTTNDYQNSRTHSQSRNLSNDIDGSQDKLSNKDSGGTNDSEEDFNHQFPSLGNSSQVSNETNQAPSVNGGVWDGAHLSKVHHTARKMQLIQKPIKFETPDRSPGTITTGMSSNDSPKLNPHASIINQANKSNWQQQASSSIYRAFVPSKNVLNRKVGKDGKSGLKEPFSSSKILSPVAVIQNNTNAGNSTSQMEILVKNPKHLTANKKSKFLKKLRSNEGNQIANGDDNDDDCIKKDDYDSQDQKSHDEDVRVNGVDMHSLRLSDSNGGDSALSSSLEAEQRLLREMGWKDEESDDEDTYAPLTEDELKEFHDLMKKLAGQQRPSSTQSLWSPKRIVSPFVANTVIVPPPDDDEDNSPSSSSSDSE